MDSLVIMVATTGLFAYHLFRFVGSFGVFNVTVEYFNHTHISGRDTLEYMEVYGSSRTTRIGALSVTTSGLFFIQVALQTFIIVFGLNVTKYKHKTGGTTNNARQNREGQGEMVKISWIRYMAICNFTVWLYSCLLLSNLSNTDPIAELGFSERWPEISRSVYPMMLFYRLHSMHLLDEAASGYFEGKMIKSDLASEVTTSQQLRTA